MSNKDKFWAVIEKLDWGKNNETDSDELQIKLKSICSEEGIEYDIVESRTHKLTGSLFDLVRDANENMWTVKLDYPSDDRMSDCIWHIIGLGKVEYHECLANKQKIVDRYNKGDFVESFAYVFSAEVQF